MSAALIYLLIGSCLLVAVVLPSLLRKVPLSVPIVLVTVGALIGMLPFSDGVALFPKEHPQATEHLAELTVLVALMGVGLAIDRPLRISRWSHWRAWAPAWRLLAITMPLCIAGVAVLAWGFLSVAPAAALLLGAALAPTDPVLASDVQVEGPTVGADDAPEEIDEDDEVRFALTSEAGLNDGLAFPFVYAAIFLATLGGISSWGWHWLGWSLVGKIAIGTVLGILIGWLLGKLAFRGPHRAVRFAEIGEPLLAFAAILITYGAAELLGGYGFLAVFAAAVTLRTHERSSEYHGIMHGIIERLEQVLTLVFLLFIGFSLANGLLSALDWRSVVIVGALLLVFRPAFGMLALLGEKRLNRRERAAVSFFGVRGIGSVYYVAYATNTAPFDDIDWLWSTVALTIVVSVILHGITSTPIMTRLANPAAGAQVRR